MLRSNQDAQDVRQPTYKCTLKACNVFIDFIVLLVTRICVLTSNLLVVISTWQAAHANRQVGAWDSRGSLIAVLLRDGACSTLYLIVDCDN